MVTYSQPAFRALADPTRRAILDLLRRGPQPVHTLARRFPVSRPAISKHLRLLRESRLVREQRAGRLRYYRLNPRPLRTVDDWLEHYRQFWRRKLERLKRYLESEGNGKPSRPKAARQRRIRRRPTPRSFQ